jgi:hypothetical protein
MITLEDESRCITKIATNVPPIPYNISGAYKEVLITNYTVDPIYIVKSAGDISRIDPSIDGFHAKHVEIRIREIDGVRNTNNVGVDISRATQRIITIPNDLLLESPVYTRILDVAICKEEHINIVVHPNNMEYKRTLITKLHEEYANTVFEAPITILANDPSGEIKEVYALIGKQIFTVGVTHFKGHGETDNILIAFRTSVNGGCIYRKHNTSFSQIDTKKYVEVGPVTIATNALTLECILQESTTCSTLEMQEHLDRIKALDKLHKDSMRTLKLELDAANSAIQTYKSLIGSRPDILAALKERELDLEYQALGTKEKDIEYQRLKLEHENDTLRLKQYDDTLKTVSTIAKTLVVVIPAAITIWKLFKK